MSLDRVFTRLDVLRKRAKEDNTPFKEDSANKAISLFKNSRISPTGIILAPDGNILLVWREDITTRITLEVSAKGSMLLMVLSKDTAYLSYIRDIEEAKTIINGHRLLPLFLGNK